MKNIIMLFLIILSIPSFSYSQSGWLLLRPYPNNAESVHEFCFPNKNTGYSVNTYSYSNYYTVFYKTTNAGVNWFRLFFTTTSGFYNLYFLNNDTGYCSIDGLYKTVNGGINWIYKSYYTGTTMTFVNNFTGYTVHGSEYGPKLSKTTNGGENWQYIDPGISGQYYYMEDIKFFNANTGLFCGSNYYLLRTTNGGLNWNFVYTPYSGIFYSISIVNDSVAFVAGSIGKVLKTSDQGLNWTSNQYNEAFIRRIEFFDENTGYASYGVSMNGKLIKTTNGGLNWENKLEIPGYEMDYFFHFFNKNEGYAYQLFGDLMKTTNGGDNWYTETPRDNFKSINMVNENTGYSGGITGNLYKTTNGSANWIDANWTIKKSFSGSSINDIYFFDLKKGLVISDSGKIFFTNDSANNWTTITMGVNSNLNRVCFIDNNTGIVIGRNGTVLKTTNSGSNWFTININISLNLNGICKTPTGSLFICGDTSFIFKSSNSGSNWNIIPTPATKHLNSIAFKNDNFGYIVGDTGTAFKTTNGGANWQKENFLITSEKLNHAVWYNDSSLCIVGNNNTLRITRNNGNYWGWPIEHPGVPGYARIYQGDINFIQFINNNLGFLCGNFGLIERTTDGGGQLINGVSSFGNNIPDKFSLSQNYPNPFNPATNIKYQIANNKFVSLKIFNILGKEIETLVNEKQSVGTYEVNWDGTGYPSGIYFYRLQAGDFSETKKMVLIK